MASFYNPETREPITTLYIGSNGKGNVALKGAPSKSQMSIRGPEVLVSGPGTVTRDKTLVANPGESRWSFTGLADASAIVATDGKDRILVQIPVKRVTTLASYKSINERFNKRGMKIDLDSHIDCVWYASEILGEGIAFRPKSAAEFKAAIVDTQLFHYDNRSDPFGKTAASATIGEGYREVSTPSLHVAISDLIASVHIDSYAFMLHGPHGDYVIGPDVGQHIFDELLFRMPMNWLRRKNHPYIASVLQAVHPVLPNSTNRYDSIIGMRATFGGTKNRDLRVGIPRLSFESSYDWGRTKGSRWNHEATLNIWSGGNKDRGPDWVFGMKATAVCRDVLCKNHSETVGLFLKIGHD